MIGQAKPNQSANWRGGAFLILTASLGSMTDILSLTGEYAYANDIEVRLRALSDITKD
jgi:hypothetical protein